ncbi:hypothetical protein FA95DRAFT_1613186 [Auriscalpium vulgare]|uniref:Uncharacterized protein n=1 Tax=Auriscalpium vulgare TaxID=40419 RepID=A0ACB8R4F9_9AGAM|nr:hypothetical protein FA95DRAFT_1613186 [Auriscalpium vulgare]
MDLDASLGGILLGTIFAVMLYGMTLLQIYIYFNDKQQDGLLLRLLVFAVLFLETIHTAFCIFNIYTMTVTLFGDKTAPGRILWSEPALILTGALLMFAVHCFFIRRVWNICEKPLLLTAFISIMALAHLGFGLATYIVVARFDTWNNFKASNDSLIVVCGGLGSSSLTDILIAWLLFSHLSRGRDETDRFASFPSSAQISPNHPRRKFSNAINLLIFYVIATGALTAVTSVGTVIAFASGSDIGIFIGMATIQSKVYANSLLTNLNTRRSIRNRLHLTDDDVEFTSILPVGVKGPSSSRSSSSARNLAAWDHRIAEPFTDEDTR